MNELLEMLRKYAARKNWNDDPEFMVDDYAAGNIDDAYQGGYDDGEADLARTVLAILETK